MRAFIIPVALALVCGALGKPAGIILGYQDTLGQYSFGYSAPDSARSEVRSVDGSTRGSYSYVDGAGVIQSAEYSADGSHGFRVAATNLPQAPSPVQDTPEVTAARVAHLLAVEQATRNVEVLQGVEDAVKAAKMSELAGNAEETRDKAEETTQPEQSALQTAMDSNAGSTGSPEEEAPIRKIDEGPQQETSGRGRAVEESAQAPVIPSVVGSLSVPLIPIQVGLDLPSFSAYSVTPVGKAEGLPQAMPAQGASGSDRITPAGTMLKSPEQQLPAAARILLPNSSDSKGTQVQAAARSSDAHQVEHARGFIAPLNIIPLGYEPTIASFLRYAPFPYITYNML